MATRTHDAIRFAAALAAVAVAAPALAGAPIVYSPSVIEGQTEFEYRSSHEHTAGVGHEDQYAIAVGHAVTSWWRPEVYVGRFERDSSGDTHFSGLEVENIFQLTPTGKYWADTGLLVSYEANPASLESDKLEFGPLFEKQTGRVMQRLNLLWEKGVGPGSTPKYEFHGGYSFRYTLRKTFAPGFEVFGEPSDDSWRAGPAFYGEKVFVNSGSELEYSAGVLFPLNATSADTTFVLRLEYELFRH